jgi:dienelactone hydrolase
MATATLTKHRLSGTLGEILIDVRGGGRSSPRPAVVVVHGFKGFKDWGMFPPLAERLAQAGFTAVLPNLSGSGVDDAGDFIWPERFGHNTFSAELADLSTVLKALRAGDLGVAPPSRVGLVGHSRGGGACILWAAQDPQIKALVTWAAISSVSRWPGEAAQAKWRAEGRLDVVNTRTGQVLPLYTDVLEDVERHGAGALDILQAAARLATPWLIVHGSSDTSVAVAEGERLAHAANPASSRFLRIESAEHTFGAAHPWKGSTGALDLAMKETVGWLSKHLL